MAAIKFSKQNIQPNPLEVDYWVDITSNPYGGNIKYYNGYDWVDLLNSKGTPINLDAYYNKVLMNQMLAGKASVESVDSKVDDTEVADVIKNIEFKDRGDEGVEMVVLKYNDMTVGVTLPVASNTTSGIITNKSFKDLVKQNQLQLLYSEIYNKVTEIHRQYQKKLKAGNNIKIDETTNTIHATGKISTDWNDLINVPDIDGAIQAETDRAKAEEAKLSARITDHVEVVEGKLDLKADKSDIYTKDQVDEKVASVYKIIGSSTFEELPIEGNKIGDVYNITNDFILNDVEYPFGTNIVWTADGWDTLSGVFDTTELEGLVEDVDIKVDEEIVRAKSRELDIQTQLDAEIARSTEADTTITQSISNAISIVKTYTDTKVSAEITRATNVEEALSTSLSTEISNREASDATLQSNIDIVDGKLINYLPLSGGTVDNFVLLGVSETSLTIHNRNANVINISSDVTFPTMVFKYKDTPICRLTALSGNFYKLNSAFTQSYKIWDEGNDGEGSGLDADMLDGMHNIDFQTAVYKYYSNDSTVPDNTELSNVLTYGSWEGSHRAFVDTKFYVSRTNSAVRSQIAYGSRTSKINYRYYADNTWSNWKTIAFTDSDITGNAATATKLATPVKLWGNDFDGSSDVFNTSVLLWQNPIGYLHSWARYIYCSDEEQTMLGTIGFLGTGNVLGKAFIGKNHENQWLTVLTNGNVGIGTTDPLYMLDVKGNVAFSGSLRAVSIYCTGIESGDYVDWYGVSWSEDSSDPTCTRIGNMALHRLLPVLSAMKGYVICNNNTGDKLELILPMDDNWTVKYGTDSNSNLSDAVRNRYTETMVKIPEFWYIDDYEPSTKIHNLKISQTAKAGWCHHKEAYVGAYEGFFDGSRFKSMATQIPTVSKTREQLRTAARANGYEDEYKWNIYTYEEHRAICHLFLVEYATRNSQLAVNTALTADGFKQGGLGSGCTTGTATINGQTVYSFIPTGTTDSLGNGSGQVAYTVTQTDADGNEIGTVTRYANRYRGIENPFGHILKHVDDIVNVYNAETTYKTVYKCNKPEHFATNKNAKYKSLCSFPGGSKMQGWSKEIKATINCDFFKYSVGGSESTYWCDYNYDNDDTSEHCLLIGGRSGSGGGGSAGLFHFDLYYSVGHSNVGIGSRLTYLPWAE